MRELKALGFRYDGECLLILDQTKLPHEEVTLPYRSVDQMVEAISSLSVRGAPAIGISASIFLADQVRRGATPAEFQKMAQMLKDARPTAVNLANNIDRLLEKTQLDYSKETMAQEAEDIFDEDVRLCEEIAKNGIPLIQRGDCVLTHCNTGALACAGRGTALGIITKAHEMGKRVRVWVDETRPLRQGARLTTWELDRAGVSYSLIVDSLAGKLMRDGDVDKVLVGADRIAGNGDTANKVGTYSLAVLAKYHNRPFFVAAPSTTLDKNVSTGINIPIEQRDPGEIRDGKALKDSPAYNPAFDVTPADLITRFILDTGVFTPTQFRMASPR